MTDRDPNSVEYQTGHEQFIPKEYNEHLKYLQKHPAFAKGDDEINEGQEMEDVSFVDINSEGKLEYKDIAGIIKQVRLGLDEVSLNLVERKQLRHAMNELENFVDESVASYEETGKIPVYGDEKILGHLLRQEKFVYAGDGGY